MKQVYIGKCSNKIDLLDHSKQIIVFGEKIEGLEAEYYSFGDVIMYKYYWDLLQRINDDYLLVINEFMTTYNRNSLNYNCVRKYCIQSENITVFQEIPIIKQAEDVMILHDFASNNPFLKERLCDVKFDNFNVLNVTSNIKVNHIELTSKQLEEYQAEKQKAIKAVNKDPNIIPRRLLKWSEKQNSKIIKDLDTKSKFKLDMNIGLNQSKVDNYYYQELLNLQQELKNVIQTIQNN